MRNNNMVSILYEAKNKQIKTKNKNISIKNHTSAFGHYIIKITNYPPSIFLFITLLLGGTGGLLYM